MSDRRYIFGIASYKRPDRQPMLLLLHEIGYTKDEIVLSTQTQEDYEEYSERYGEMAQVIYGEAHSVGGNKNTLMRYVMEHYPDKSLVVCSDKVRGVGVWERGAKDIRYIEDINEMDSIIRKAFGVTRQLKGSLWGVYPVGNTFYMAHNTTINQQMLGCFMGFVKPSADFLFDEEQVLKEDFEIIMRHISRGHRAIRFNDLCLKATLHTQGGCHAAWNSDGDSVNRECTFRLLSAYPKLVAKHATRENEVRYIGPTKVINKSILD